MTIASTGMDAVDSQICPHLAPALRQLLAQGCAIIGSATNAWSRIDREITLNRGPAPAELPPGLTGTRVGVWSNADPRYPIAHGLLCTSCRHSLGWPRRDAPSDQPSAT
jgi:hypothetical protein